MPASRPVECVAVRNGLATASTRVIPEETAVSLVYNGGSYAVMMASPADLEDFATGFALSEGLVQRVEDLGEIEVVEHRLGFELRHWLPQAQAARLAERRRHVAGPTGCGLCGIDSLAQAVRPARSGTAIARFSPHDISAAQSALAPAQLLNAATRAVHAAAFWTPRRGLVAVREDVGRHNALDKLVGCLARAGLDAAEGMILLTSRVSVEMVQKAAVAGTGLLVAVSAPTALAVETADAAGMTLVAVARTDGFEIFTHPHRIQSESLSHVA